MSIHTFMETEVLILGAGPIGIELAANLKRFNVPYLHMEAGRLAETIARWPRTTPFFSSPERVAVAGVPLQTVHQSMVTGEEYLAYLRGVVEIHDLDVMLYCRVTHISAPQGPDGGFTVTADRRGKMITVRCRKIVLATGNMHEPRRLGIPGEESSHVDHSFGDVHRYFRQKLLIVGGRNSAVEAAIRCFRAGSDVVLMHRKPDLEKDRLNSRYFLEFSILRDKRKIGFIGSAELVNIRKGSAEYRTADGGINTVDSDFVLICAGFDKDLSLLESAGARFDAEMRPVLDDTTMESTVPGLYLAGTASGGGFDSYKTFIGTSHAHVEKIVFHICGADAVTGGYKKRGYPFSIEDIEPTEGSAGK